MVLLDLQFGVDHKKNRPLSTKKNDRRFWLHHQSFFPGKKGKIPLNPRTAGAAILPSKRRPSGPREGERTRRLSEGEKKQKKTLALACCFLLLPAGYQPLCKFSNCGSRRQVGGRSPLSPWHLFPRHFHYHNRFMK